MYNATYDMLLSRSQIILLKMSWTDFAQKKLLNQSECRQFT